MEIYLKYFVSYFLFSGIAKSFIITMLYFFNFKEKGEKHVQTMSNLGGVFDILLLSYIVYIGFTKTIPKTISFGDILGINSNFVFYTDQISFLYLFASFIILGLVGRFSCFYLHKDKHYYKFFSLFYIFQSAAVLLVLSDNFASYFIGWELLGISSVLLISFYSDRISPVKNSLRIFSFYKISDILLFSGFAVAYANSQHQLFSEFVHIDLNHFSLYMFLTSLAIMIKMGGFPVIWLPRAMEGPTPSSAIFYGALATHIPLLLFIKLWAGAEVLPWVRYVLLSMLIFLVLISTLLSRIQSDAKNILAYATVKHISIISIEVLFGLFHLACVHLLFHCLYRLSQFIRTPSLLYEFHQAEGYRGSAFKDPGWIYHTIMPLSLRRRFYRMVLREFYFVPRVYRLVDILLGMTSRVSVKKVAYICGFNLLMFAFLFGAEWHELHEFHTTLFLLLPAWTFSLFALLINYHDWRYLVVVVLSVLSLASVVLYVDEFISLNSTIALYVALFTVLSATLMLSKLGAKNLALSPKLKLILFVLGLWIVGVPGPGTYYMFEKAIHLSMGKDIYLAIGAFVILSINTLGVVKNYSLDEVHFKGSEL